MLLIVQLLKTVELFVLIVPTSVRQVAHMLLQVDFQSDSKVTHKCKKLEM